MSKKPLNVIILTSDEMRADAPAFMGNPDCKTPNLDRFAKSGVVFANHFTVHGKCVPSRIAMMTGRYCHTDGFRTIFQHLPAGQPNLMSKLRSVGYECAVFGHNHVWEDLNPGEEKHKEQSEGAAHYHSFVKPFHDMAFTEHAVPEPRPDAPQPIASAPEELRTSRIEGTRGGCIDLNRAYQAVKYLKEIRDRSKPFYLHVNMGSPHPAYQAEEPYYSMYDRNAIRAWPHGVPENAPLPLSAMRELRSGGEPEEAVLRELQAVYYAMCTRVDHDLGVVLTAIEEEGLMENSIVLFTTDHGDFAGQYGLPEKWDTAMNDCIMRSPLVLRAPGLPEGQCVGTLTEHVDIPKTVMELLDIKPDWGIHGGSLLPALRGEQRKEAVFGDGGHEEEMWSRFNFERTRADGTKHKALNGKQVTYAERPETMSRTKMVRTEEWKLVVRLTGGNELYHMRRDPDEMHNLWPAVDRDPRLQEIVRDLQQKMLEWCLRTDTDRPWQKNVGA